MILKSLYYDPNGIARGIVENNSRQYNVSICREFNRSWCSCAYNLFNKSPCKHIMFLLGEVDLNKMVKKKILDRLETGCKTIDDLLAGGVPYSIVSGVYGKPMAGKSMFCYQIALANIKDNDRKVLYIDTEGIRVTDIRRLMYKFGERFDLKPEEINNKIEIISTLGDVQLKSLQKLFRMFGEMVTLDQSKGGKYTPHFEVCHPTYDDKKLGEYSMIIIDSLSKPIKDAIGSNTPNLPARSQIQERLFGMLTHKAMMHNLAIIINHHTTRNPAMPFGEDFGTPSGGDAIMYNTKYVLEFWTATNKIKNDSNWGIEARRVRLFRHPTEQVTGEWQVVRLKKDYGYTDE